MDNFNQENSAATGISTSHHSTMGIRGRLLIGFGAITLIFLSAVIISSIIITNTQKYSENIINIHFPSYTSLQVIDSRLYDTQSNLLSYLLTDKSQYIANFNIAWNQLYKAASNLNSSSKLWQNQSNIEAWNSAYALLATLKNQQESVITLAKSNKQEAINVLQTSVEPTLNNLFDIIDGKQTTDNIRTGGIFDTEYNQVIIGGQTIISDINFVKLSQYIISIFGVILSVIIALYTSRSILRHIDIFRKHSSRIASGDLRQQITVQSRDEIGQLGHDLNIMTAGLSNITKQITHACHNMVTTLDEVKRAVDSQSSGATEQASSINEITASLEEIEKSSNQTLEKAKTLGEAAERTREKGQQGLEAVEQSVLGMKAVREKVQMIAQTILELSNQTQQVGEITSVVNTLAQQSKMLALNASIEAAKAGDAGKGFAVVAAEVKNLAEQSEQSTIQVQKILEDIRHAAEKAVMVTEEGTKGVDYGTGLVEQTGEVVRNLRDVIQETMLATQQIEAAVRQEGVGIEQITAGMNEINQVTSSFVATTKQTTEAINDLSSIAQGLKEHVDTYKT